MKSSKLSKLLIILAIFLNAGLAHAKVAPLVPYDNPHPPVTELDKKRVAFAESILKDFLIHQKFTGEKDFKLINDNKLRFNMDKNCQLNMKCLSDKALFDKYLSTIQSTFGTITKYRHAHIIPWAFERIKRRTNKYHKVLEENVEDSSTVKAAGLIKPMPKPVLAKDEYMIHAYVMFNNASGWHHVNVIISEDNKGNLSFSRFFIMKIPVHKMPPGVVC